MSGGVDSSVSAALLLEQGYEVFGAFMKNWSGDVNGPECKVTDRVGEEHQECGWKQERRDAARVAAQLDIPFVTFDFEEQYRHDVVEEMFDEFAAGRTPNPDVLCNKYIKFDRFVQAADQLGCGFVATGHYARVSALRPSTSSGNNVHLLMSSDANKDQTYFLWAINKNVLSRVLFPIGHLTKPEVRAEARARGLVVAEKKDSTGICFVGEVPMRSFLQARIPDDPGDIITTDGRVVGHHQGVAFYTIGQRHGLEVGGGTPFYVVEKRLQTKELIVSSNFHPSLFKKQLIARQINWLVDASTMVSGRYQVRIRHRQPLQFCTLSHEKDQVRVDFDEPQRAITSGQSVVFYDGQTVLGGGIITDA